MKISINLLPPEILEEHVKKATFYKIQTVGIAAILVVIFLSALTLALGLLQGQRVVRASSRVDRAKQQISGLKDKQAALFLLNNRLTTIEKNWAVSSKQSSMYKLISSIIPASVQVNAISVNNEGETVFLALASDVTSMDNLVTILTDKDSNRDLIKEISIDSINRGRDGVYRVSFKVMPK